MISYHEYTEYFKKLAQWHPSIEHTDKLEKFFTASLEDVLSAIGNNRMRYPAVILLPLEIVNLGHDDNKSEKLYGGFMILDAMKAPMLSSSRRQAILNDTRLIAEDFIQKILYDAENCIHPFDGKVFSEFNELEVKKKEWGPVWDNAFGWSYQFPLIAPYHHVYTPSLWPS